jgi:hypothetical protein
LGSQAIITASGKPEWNIYEYMTAFTAGSEEISPDVLYVNGELLPDSLNLIDSLLLRHHSVKILYLTFSDFENFMLLIKKLEPAYVMHHVEIKHAVFVRKEISDRLSREVSEPTTAWMLGFYCNPLAVEKFPGFFEKQEIPFETKFMDEFNVGYNAGLRIAANENRAYCYGNICECIPPWRGFLCERIDRGVTNETSLAIYFLVTDSTVSDLVKALRNLHANFNKYFRYPVVVFYDKPLDEPTRLKIRRASDNSIWIVQAFGDSHPPPSKAHLGKSGFGKNSVHPRSPGYRSICRFESGPVFFHPAVRSFRLLLRLDTDGYFTFDAGHVNVEADFRQQPPNTVRLVSGYVAVSASRLNHLEEMISVLKHTIPSRQANSTLSIEVNGVLMSADSPPYVFDADFFRSDEYQKYWHLIDSVDGFENFGWLGNTVITAGVELLGRRFAFMPAPTGHQVVCACDEQRARLREHVCVASAGTDESSEVRWTHRHGLGVWKCVHRDQIDPVKCKPYNQKNLFNQPEDLKYLWCDQ